MSKSIIVVLIGVFTTVLNAEIWRDDYIIAIGFDKEIVCKNGYLMSIITKTDHNITQRIEQQYCYDISAWNSGCLHPPVKCEKGK